MIGSTPPRERRAAALLAALLTAAGLCGGDVLARSYPFGPRTRDVNDLGNQYVPFHAHLWDLLHGRADGGLLVNWQSGYGSSFLPDLGTYLSSPFAPLVALFPRDEIDLAVYVITVLKTRVRRCRHGLAAARACAPARWWAAGLLGRLLRPVRLDRVLRLVQPDVARRPDRPARCCAWSASGRGRGGARWRASLVVALAWIANFYTAYMATLGAALVLLLRLWPTGSAPPAARSRRWAGPRSPPSSAWAWPHRCVTVVYVGTARLPRPGQASSPRWPRRTCWPGCCRRRTASRSPALYVGTTALLLALALPFHRAVPVRVRAGWTAAGRRRRRCRCSGGPTHLVWHAFAAPNGSAVPADVRGVRACW